MTTKKTFDAVKFMRQERDKLSEKLSKMSKNEILEAQDSGRLDQVVGSAAKLLYSNYETLKQVWKKLRKRERNMKFKKPRNTSPNARTQKHYIHKKQVSN